MDEDEGVTVRNRVQLPALTHIYTCIQQYSNNVQSHNIHLQHMHGLETLSILNENTIFMNPDAVGQTRINSGGPENGDKRLTA
jgi:hypothetical protein